MEPAKAFILSYPAGSQEREYYCVVLAIIDTIDFDRRDEGVGIALLSFITEASFRGAGIDTSSHPCAGCRAANAELIAAIFHECHKPAMWWITRSLEAETPSLEALRIWWKEQFFYSPLVEQVH